MVCARCHLAGEASGIDWTRRIGVGQRRGQRERSARARSAKRAASRSAVGDRPEPSFASCSRVAAQLPQRRNDRDQTSAVSASRPGCQRTSPPPPWFTARASDEQIVRQAVEIGERRRVERPSCAAATAARSARRDDRAGEVQLRRRRAPPPGRMKLVSGAESRVHRVDLALEPRRPGPDDAQRHRRREILAGRGEIGAEIEQFVLDARRASRARRSSPSAASATPIALFASSTSPIAAMRGSALDTREPSTSPVVPASPVRV